MAVWGNRIFGRRSGHVLPGFSKRDMARINAEFEEFDRQLRQAEAELRANPYHPDPRDNPGIEAALQAAPPEAWHRLWSAVDEVLAESEEQRGTWRFENPDGSLCMPHVHYSAAIGRMIGALHAVEAIVDFPYRKWALGSVYPQGAGLATAPVADAARVVTAVVCAERFCDGTILAALGNGTLPAALNRLRAWYDQLNPMDAAEPERPA